MEEEVKKKSSVKIILVLVALILIVIVGLSIYFLRPSAKRIFMHSVSKLYSLTEKSLSDNYDSIYASITAKPQNISGNLNGYEKIIEKFALESNTYTDYKNKKFLYNINVKYDNKDLIDVDIQYDKDMYVSLNNLYNKWIKIDDVSVNEVFEKTNNKDVNVILKGLVDAFNDSLKDEYFKMNDTNIELNGKKIKVKENTLILNKTNVSKIEKDIYQNLINNDDFIKSYSNITNKTKDKVKSELKDALTNNDLDFETIEVTLYTKNNDVVMLSVNANNNKIEITKGNSENSYIYSLKSNELEIKFEMKLDIKYNNTENLKDTSNFVSSEGASNVSLEIIGNLSSSDAFKTLNSDMKNITGFGFEDLMSNMLSSGNY